MMSLYVLLFLYPHITEKCIIAVIIYLVCVVSVLYFTCKFVNAAPLPVR